MVEKIDALVRKGRYKNRTELIREQIMRGIEKISLVDEEPALNEKLQPILDKLLLLEKPPDILRTKTSIADIVSKERER